MGQNRSNVSNFSKGMSLPHRVGFYLRVMKNRRRLNRLVKEAMAKKACYFGPFKGEFGHFLGHALPFMSWLHEQGVKIHYCGMALHKPLMLDDEGNLITESFHELRDFFKEVPPRTNKTVPPADVQAEIDKWEKKARKSGLPFINIGDHFLYWFVVRLMCVEKGWGHTYNLKKAYQTKEENSVVIFPRRRGAKPTANHGAPWDYMEVARKVAPFFGKVYLVGHPAQSEELQTEGNIEVCLSTDNRVMLEKVANSKLIITQHSGAVYLGEYLRNPVLVIFKGEGHIESLQNTVFFKGHLGNKKPMEYAISLDEIAEFCEPYQLQPA